MDSFSVIVDEGMEPTCFLSLSEYQAQRVYYQDYLEWDSINAGSLWGTLRDSRQRDVNFYYSDELLLMYIHFGNHNFSKLTLNEFFIFLFLCRNPCVEQKQKIDWRKEGF